MTDDLKARVREAMEGIGPLPLSKSTAPDGTARLRQVGQGVIAGQGMPHPVARFLMRAHELLPELLGALEKTEAERETYRDALMPSAEVGAKAIRERDAARAILREVWEWRGPDEGRRAEWRDLRQLEHILANEEWSNECPPGGMVCRTCGQPVESEPCAEHTGRLS